MKLQIERESLKKEKDELSLKRKEEIKNKLFSLEQEEKELRNKWNEEKELSNKIKAKKEELERANHNLEIAESNYDYEKAAVLKHGTIPKLQEELKKAISESIKSKNSNLVNNMASQGTTPRQLTDLIGSLCDLTSGSGDKGTPIILVQGYFDNYTN